MNKIGNISFSSKNSILRQLNDAGSMGKKVGDFRKKLPTKDIRGKILDKVGIPSHEQSKYSWEQVKQYAEEIQQGKHKKPIKPGNIAIGTLRKLHMLI